jgi:Transposase IS116/IS110/IS902 family
VHAVLAKLGVPVTCTGNFGVWGNTWLDGLELGQPYAGKAASPRALAAALAAGITVLEAAIADLLAHHDGYHAIRALPGIGPVLAAVLITEIGDITRFATPARLCSQSGTAPRHRESDARVSRGHITKQGSPLVRWALVEASRHVPSGRSLRQRRTTSSPAAPKKPRTPQRSPPPASCSPGSLRDARRPGRRPGRQLAEGGVSRPGRRQRVTAGFTGPAPAGGRLA